MKELRDLGDNELIELSKKGDSRAFGVIISRYEEQVARTVISMLGNTQEAEDVGQETFIRFYNSLDKFRGDSALATYITRIAINLSLNEIKKNKKTVSLFERTDSIPHPDVIEPDNDFENNEKREMIETALKQLHPSFRSVVVLRLVQGYSTKETARILQLPVGTVLSRLSRAQKSLKEILTPLMK